MIKTYLNRFCRDEDGAVTVDWVVLTGGILILGILVTAPIITGATSTSSGVSGSLANAQVPSIRFQ